MLELHERPAPVALRVDGIFDGRTIHREAGSVIVLDGDRIASIDREPPEQAHVYDLSGCTALPGLVDTHVHLALDATDDPVPGLMNRDDDELTEWMVSAGRRALSAGITTVRDLGDRNYLSLSLRGRHDLPTLLLAGPPITTPAGHCWFMGGGTEPEPHSIRRAVAEHAERGVDVIKVMASGGTLTSGTRQERSQYSQDMLRMVVAEAHRWGLPVTAHAHGTASIAESLAAGVDGMEHVTFWSEDGVDAPQYLLDQIAASGIFVGATLGFDPPGDYAGLPTPLRSRLPHIDQNTARLRDAGARVVVGSDAGVASVKHHAVLPFAASQLSAMGANPTQILETLTSAAAAACGVEDRKGWLRPGYDADVLVVRGDPTRDLAALHAVRIVVRAGRVLVDTGDAQPA